jgi:hypothetical protein
VAQRPPYALTECAGDCFVSGVDNLKALGYLWFMAKAEQYKIRIEYKNGLTVTKTRSTLRAAEAFRRKMGADSAVKRAEVIAPKPIIPKRKDLK